MKTVLYALLIAASLTLSGDAQAKECTPPFPYSCSTVRWAVATFSRSYLERKGRERGMTACHRAHAKACIAGAP